MDFLSASQNPPKDTSSSDEEEKVVENVNINDSDAFPALGPTAKPLVFATPVAWQKPKSSALGKSTNANVGDATEVLDILPSFQDARVAKSGPTDIVKAVLHEISGIHIEQSRQSRTGTLTFVIRGKNRDDVVRAKRLLASRCCVKTLFKMTVPSSAKPRIIGAGGKNLKALTSKTLIKIDIGRDSRMDEDDEEVSDIVLSGDADGIEMARREIEAIVTQIAARSQQTVSGPKKYRPFLVQQVPRLQEEYGIKIHVPPFEPGEGSDEVLLVGEKDSVRRAAAEIGNLYQQFGQMQTIMLTLPKAKHRFLIGPKAATLQEILEQTGCVVEIPPADSDSEQVIVHGPQVRLLEGLTAVLDRANSQHIASFDIRNLLPSQTNVEQFLKFINTKERQALRSLESEGEGCEIKNLNQPVYEITCKSQAGLDHTLKRLKEIIEPLAKEYRFGVLDIPQALHKHVIGKGGSGLNRIRTKFEEALGGQGKLVDMVLPYKDDENSDGEGVDEIIFVVKPASTKSDTKAFLAQARQEIEGLVKELADFATVNTNVDKKFHSRLIGHNASFLKDLLAPYEGQVAIRFPKAKDTDVDPNTVTLRGPKEKVEDLVQRIKERVGEWKHQDIMCSFNDTVTVPKGIGKRMANVTGDSSNPNYGWLFRSLKDRLAVDKSGQVGEKDLQMTRVDLTSDDKGDVFSITGHKRIVELAKEIIQDRGNKVADSTVLTVSIATKYHSRIIGKGGKQLNKLQGMYGVVIKFPTKEASDEDKDKITIRGGKSDAEKAKQELLDLVEWEKSQSHNITFTVPDSALAHVVGRGGANINAIKDETGCRIDVGKPSESGEAVTITIVGGQKEAEEAKQRILAVASEITEAAVKMVPLARRLHKTLIGPGGVTIRNFVNDVATEFGVSEAQIRIKIPKDDSDQVELKAPGKVIDKIAKKLLENFDVGVDVPKDSTTEQFSIPRTDVARVVGRGGEVIRDLMSKHKVDIQIDKIQSGSKEEAIVQVIGSADSLEACKQEILSKVRSSTHISLPQNIAIHASSDQQLQRKLRDHGASVEITSNGISVHGDAASLFKAQEHVEKHIESMSDFKHHDTMSIASNQRSRVIGQRGQTLQNLRKQTGTLIDFDKDQLHFTAKTPEALEAAKKAVEDVLTIKESNKVTKTINIPAKLHGQIIGTRGAGLRELESQVGSDVQIKFPPRGSEEVRLTGTSAQVEQLIALLNTKMQELGIKSEEPVVDIVDEPVKKSLPPGYSGRMASKTPYTPVEEEEFAPVPAESPEESPKQEATWSKVGSSVKKFKERKMQENTVTGVSTTNGYDALKK